MAVTTKTYLYKVYSSAGTYLGTWPQADISSELSFSQEINSTGSEVTIKLSRSATSFDEGNTVNFNNKVQIYCIDSDAPNGTLVYQGFISNYTPVIDGKDEYVEVKLLGYGSTLSQVMLRHDPPLNPYYNNVEQLFYLQNLGSPQIGGTNYVAFSFVPDVTISGISSVNIFSMTAGSQVGIFTDSNGLPGSQVGSYSSQGVQGTGYQTILTGGNTFALSLTGISSITANAPVFNDTQYLTNYTFSPTIAIQGDGLTRFWFVVKFSGSNVFTTPGSFSSADSNYGIATSSNSGSTWSLFAGSFMTNADTYGVQILSTNPETTVSYTATDPSVILQDVITKYNAAGGVITYSGTIDLTNTAVSLKFNTNTILDAINLILASAPGGWYWYVDQATNFIHFHSRSTSANNSFILGKDISTFKPEKRLDDVINVVYVTGTNLYKKYTNSTSVTTYGERMSSFVDSRIADSATAQQVAYAILANYAAPQTRLSFEIVDNNGNTTQGKNIEAIQVGQTVTFRAFESYSSNLWDVGLWDTARWDYDITQYGTYVLQITRVDYTPDKVTITASTTPPDVTKQVDQIKKKLDDTQTVDNPAVPTP